MQHLVLTKGLPCSGKTTWAKAWTSKAQKRVRVSWSDLLADMNCRSRRYALPLAMDAAARLMCQALREGFDVVIDEENLRPSYFGLFLQRAYDLRVKIEWKVFDTSVEECKRRDAQREHPVGALEIERKFERYELWLKQK